MSDLLRRAIDAFNDACADPDSDVEVEARDYWHPEARFEPRYAQLEGRSFRGPAGIAEFVRDVRVMCDRYRVDLERVDREGDTLAAVCLIDARTRDPVIELHVREGLLVETEHGRIRLLRVFEDPADAYRAAGLDPSLV